MAEQRREERIEESLDRLTAAVAALDRPDTELLRTTTSRPFWAAPSKGAVRLHTIPAGALIECLGWDGQWCRVVYRLPDSAVALVGWVYNRGLVPVAEDDLEDEASDQR